MTRKEVTLSRSKFQDDWNGRSGSSEMSIVLFSLALPAHPAFAYEYQSPRAVFSTR